jgi:hypothetical protein
LSRILASCLLAAMHALAGDASPSRWSLDGGWGIRLWDNAGVPEAEREYLEQARVGRVYGFDVSVFPWKHWGLGIQQARFFASASDTNVTFVDKSMGDARDEYRILYVAPAVYATREVADKIRLTGNAGAGVFFYHNEAKEGPFPGVLEGTTPGIHASGAVDLMLTSRFAVGFGVRALYGELEKLRYNAIPARSSLSLSRVDFTAGIRFYP